MKSSQRHIWSTAGSEPRAQQKLELQSDKLMLSRGEGSLCRVVLGKQFPIQRTILDRFEDVLVTAGGEGEN